MKLVKPRKASESMMRIVNTKNHCRKKNEVIRIWVGLEEGGGRLTGRKRKGRSYFGILTWWERIRALKARRPWRRASLIRRGVRFVQLVVRTVFTIVVPNGREEGEKPLMPLCHASQRRKEKGEIQTSH